MRSYLYCYLNIVPVMESKKTRWVGHAAGTGKKKVQTRRERDHFEGLGVDISIILK